jgi:hypothetical protein
MNSNNYDVIMEYLIKGNCFNYNEFEMFSTFVGWLIAIATIKIITKIMAADIYTVNFLKLDQVSF